MVHYPTDEMTGDYFAKPPQGAKFRKLWSQIMGLPDEENHQRWKIVPQSSAPKPPITEITNLFLTPAPIYRPSPTGTPRDSIAGVCWNNANSYKVLSHQ